MTDSAGRAWLRQLELDPGELDEELAQRLLRLAWERLTRDGGVAIGTFEGLGLGDEQLELIATRALEATKGGGWTAGAPVWLEDPRSYVTVSGTELERIESVDSEMVRFSRPHVCEGECRPCDDWRERMERIRRSFEAPDSGPNYWPSTPLPGWVQSSGASGVLEVRVGDQVERHELQHLAPNIVGLTLPGPYREEVANAMFDRFTVTADSSPGFPPCDLCGSTSRLYSSDPDPRSCEGCGLVPLT